MSSTGHDDLVSQQEDMMDDADSDDEMDWEEVEVPSRTPANEEPENTVELGPAISGAHTGAESSKGIEITLKKGKRLLKKQNTVNAQAAAQRALRLQCHKIHTVALLANALIRNKWINDPLLHARLMSMTPLHLQMPFSMISRKREPESAKRGRLFEAAILRLTEWWYQSFDVEDTDHLQSRTYDQVEKALKSDTIDYEEGEFIRSSKSLMKHALMNRGSRDTSSQLFTALCRTLDIPARLVVSLQSVPWQAKVGKETTKSGARSKKGKDEGPSSDESESDEDDMVEVDIESASSSVRGTGSSRQSLEPVRSPAVSTAKGKGKAEDQRVVKLRKSKPTGRRLGSRSSPSHHGMPSPPVFWTEVFSRPDGRWLPVDPVRYIVNKRKVFHPSAHDKNNRMVYVVAIEQDGYVRDVTQRYATEYAAKTAKLQLRGKGRQEWWSQVMRPVTRPFRLHRDDVEDEEFEIHQITEGMPTSIGGFKDHPIYALERHLKRDEVIFPKTELGKFRGETVYHRSNIVPLKTAENWLRTGRQVKEGCQAMKWVKARSVTIHRRRAMELAQQQGEEMLQGLYAESQTEIYKPDPVVDGKVPKNDFGNIDLYVPSMLPAGAAFVPYKGATKIARQLGFDYAEAVTGFEFRKGRAFPIITGLVVAVENEEPLLDAYQESEQRAEEKAREKHLDNVMKQWVKLIQGLRIHQRLQKQYVNGDISSVIPLHHQLEEDIDMDEGGFVQPGAVIQPFYLPRNTHVANTANLATDHMVEGGNASDGGGEYPS